MTEGPEATYLRGNIWRRVGGKHLQRIEVRGGRYKHKGRPKGMNAFVRDLPLRLRRVRKKGKVIFFFFDNGWCMIARMGMTGWFSGPDDTQLFESSPNIIFHFDTPLYWMDFRNFGTLTFTRDTSVIAAEFDKIAPDIMNPRTTLQKVYPRVQRLTKRKLSLPIDVALMDQTLLVSGVGNIIKSEALYNAGISPRRTLKTLSKPDWRRLLVSTQKIGRKVLQHLESRGAEGYFDQHAVYQRLRDPSGHTVRRYKSADGRTTYWVPTVQR